MIEFGDIIVRFVTNRGVTHELVRHRLCSFAQESTRYVRYDGGMEFIRPVWCSKSVLGEWNYIIDIENNHDADIISFAEGLMLKSRLHSELTYQKLLQEGWRPEQAREELPNSLKTEIVTKGNIREWRHIFQLRCSKKAHPQIRGLMLPLLSELKEKIPVVFDDIGE
jgi:thymidylate synthase (FAD)